MSSSRAPRFTEAELEALDSWTASLQHFGAPRSENVEVSQATQVLTVEQIEDMQKQAYAEAFAQGKAEGFQQGHGEGFEKGHTEGHTAGYRTGYEEAQHLLQKQAAELTRLLETLAEPLKQLDREIETELVKLAFAVAGQIVRREIKLHPDEIVAVVREALGALPLASQKITVNLHPEDADLVRAILNLDENLPPWRLVENPLVTRGGCTVETEASRVDASLEKRLAAVIAAALGGERQEDAA